MTAHRHIAILVVVIASAVAVQGCAAHAGDRHLSGHDTQPSAGSFPAIEGTWHEETPTACQKAAGDANAWGIGELKFTADGKFNVTWVPFETYVDYWGTYTYDRATGALTMTVESGNHVPTDAKLAGTARTDPDGKLQITGIFFGTPGGEPGHNHTSDCPLVFKH